MNYFFKSFCLLFTLLLAGQTCSAQNRMRFDSINPGVHDPVIAQGEDGRYYIFSTGMGVGVMSSADLKSWKREPSAVKFDMPRRDRSQAQNGRRAWPKAKPEWAVDSVRGYRGHMWAPDIIKHNGLWYLYYSCSTFGKNRSAIGVMTNKTLDPKSADFKWEDKGPVVVSHQHKDNFNAIDPNVIIDRTSGDAYLTFGSFWDGIQLVKLDKSLTKPTTAPRTIARRMTRPLTLAEVDDPATYTIEGGDTVQAGENAIEAPFITYHDGYYYLFVSWDYCCRGQRSTYKTVYGRSKNVEGPYLDMNGKDMAYGGGTLLIGPNDIYYGVGHCGVADLQYEGKIQPFFICHAYHKDANGGALLYLKKLIYNKDGSLKLEDLR